MEHVVGDFATINKARLGGIDNFHDIAVFIINGLLVVAVEFFVEETIATECITHVHIHHSPWCEYRLLVGVVECTEYPRDALDAVIDVHGVGFTGADALPCHREHCRIIALLELVEYFRRYTARHKFVPRSSVTAK